MWDDESGSDSGSAYIFEMVAGGWAQTAKLAASDAVACDQFCWSVAISGDIAVVGTSKDGWFFVQESACNDRPDYTGSGAAYVFVKPPGGWSDMTQTAKLTASDTTEVADFKVAINGDTAIVGAYGAYSG